MSFAPQQAYHSSEPCHPPIFDARVPGAVERPHGGRAGWRSRGGIEAPDGASSAPVVRNRKKWGTRG